MCGALPFVPLHTMPGDAIQYQRATQRSQQPTRPTGDALASALNALDREGDTWEVAIGEVLIELPNTAVPEPLRQAGPVWWWC
jgi:hypothetical protein